MIKSFFEYLKNPVTNENSDLFTFRIYFKLIGMCYLFLIISSIFLRIITSFDLLPEYAVPKIESFAQSGSIILFLFVVIFGPLLEEILFRLNLKITKLNISAFLTAVLMLIIQVSFFRKFQFFIYLSTIPLFIVIYYLIRLYDFPLEKIDNFVKSKFRYVFHVSAIVFGMIHLTNYATIYWWMIVLIPFLTAPYIAMGYVFGYARMKYGFANGLLMHSTINFISVLLTMPKHFFDILQ